MLFNVLSEYSLLSSTLRIDDYITEAKRLGYTAIGLADNQVMHGALQFYTKAKANGIKPLIGLKVSLQSKIRNDKKYPFLLYAASEKGYQLLIKLSRMVENSQVNDSQVWSFLESNATDLVYISCGRMSELEQAIIHDEATYSEEILAYYQNVFGKQNVYMGLTIYPFNQSEIDTLQQFAQKYQLKQVVGQLVNSLKPDEAFSLQILNAIKENEIINQSLRYSKGTNYLFSSEELQTMFEEANLHHVWQNTIELSQTLNAVIDTSQSYLPKFKVPDGLTASAYLKDLTFEELRQSTKKDQKEYQERLEYELKVIETMGFSDYFLIVWDIIKYCHEKHIRIGPGRGSAAGSLVSYLLKITLVDPIEFDLLFERFLNPERYNMPDIDIDIPDDKRELVLKYIQKRYGNEQVAQIVTMGTFGAKASIRDTLRVVGANTETLKAWSKAIPSDQNQLMTLDRALKQSQELRAIISNNEYNQEIFKAAKTIEGLPRHNSTHAAAVVISDFPLEEIIPVKDRENDLLITQFTMNDVEQMGLLKMDFLGLRNLTILDSIINNVKHNKQIEIDPLTISMDDDATLKIFQTADTNGVFQFESDGIKDVLKRLKPESFEDIVAVNALYRPGPMKQIDTFINRKHGKEAIQYVHPILEPILKNTYGIIVYQEQVMQIVVQMAGFSLGEADILRRAMGKKQVAVMERERSHFMNGARAKGFSDDAASEVYNYIYEFSNYGFNRAHAVVYSTLAYQLAFLKANYPEEFYQAILNNGRSNLTSSNMYIQEAKTKLKKILSLDINLSEANFSVNGGLRIGFNTVNGIKGDLIRHIVEDRSQLGPYKTLLDFLQRLPRKMLKIDVVKPLIYAGAFDEIGYNRATLIQNLPAMLQSVEFSGLSMSLFEEMEPKIEWVKEYSLLKRLEQEKETLGFTVSGHPLDAYKNLLETNQEISNIAHVLTLPAKRKISILVMIQTVKIINTKNNDLMAFATVGDEFNSIDIVVFPQTYQRYNQLLTENRIIIVEGMTGLDRRNNPQIITNRIYAIEEYLQSQNQNKTQKEIQRCFIQIKDFKEDSARINMLKQLALQYFGPASIVLVDKNRRTIQLDPPYTISYSHKVQQELKEIFGQANVVFK